MVTGPSLYQEVVTVTEHYFGPAADRFIARQVHNHLNKNPEILRKEDLAGLTKWISLAMALLVDDEKLIKKYVSELEKLVDKQSPAK